MTYDPTSDPNSAPRSTRRSALVGALVMLLLVAGILAAGYFYLQAEGYYVRVESKLGDPAADALRFAGSAPPRFERMPDDRGPQNVILLIADGMGFSQLTGARMALVGPDGRLNLERFPVTGWSSTHSAREVYTDSAAGATALSTGVKTDPGHIATDPEGRPLVTLFERAREAGKAVGFITDSMIFDATPAAFVAHRDSRRDYLGIAEDALALRPDLMIGETRSAVDESEAWQALFDRYEESGYGRVHDLESARELAPDAPLLGLFPHGSIADPDRGPDLAALTALALERLRGEAGFVLLVETEETDSGSHRGEFDRVVRGMAALDRAARLAVDFAQADGNTLIVATADHETGALAILGGDDGEPQRVRWGTRSHSAEPVPVLAYGPGSEAFSGVLDNAEIGRLLAAALETGPSSSPGPDLSGGSRNRGIAPGAESAAIEAVREEGTLDH